MSRIQSVLAAAALTVATVIALPVDGSAGAVPVNVDVSQRHLNESEEAIAVNPTNPNNIVMFTNIGHAEAGLTAGMFLGRELRRRPDVDEAHLRQQRQLR